MDFIVETKCKHARLGKDVRVELDGKIVEESRIVREVVRRGIRQRSIDLDSGRSQFDCVEILLTLNQHQTRV